MKILIFGATGMVGQGVLRECLAAADVSLVQTVGRNTTGQTHPKLRELRHANMFDYASIEENLKNFDACFFCLGVTSSGRSEADYTKLTYDVTLAAATTLARLNPQMTFTYVSGTGTDSTEKGRSMWARVKGRTENALQRLPFKAVYLFRPGAIVPLQGITSKTALYQRIYDVFGFALPFLRWLAPNTILTTEIMGQAMLNAVRRGAPKAILESPDINQLAKPI